MLAATIVAFCGAAVDRVGAGPRELLPHPSAYRMANTARAVVEGTLGDGGVVTVTKRYFVRAGDRIGEKITVPSLVDMPLELDAGLLGAQPGAAIDPDGVLLFLCDNPNGDEWVPLHLCAGAARGVLWLQGENVYGYAQSLVPGSYGLQAWVDHAGGEPATVDVDDLRKIVADGVVARIAWRDTLHVDDAGKRAAALARWFSPSTSPDGARWRERVWPDLMQAVDGAGEELVAALARIVQTDPDAGAAETAAAALARIGDAARSATPALIARLRVPLGVAPIHLVKALRRFADPRARDVLRDLVPHADPFVAAEAALALHASGGEGAARLLAARVPREGDDLHGIGAIEALVAALHELDPDLAERIVRERFLDLDQLMMRRPWLRRLR